MRKSRKVVRLAKEDEALKPHAAGWLRVQQPFAVCARLRITCCPHSKVHLLHAARRTQGSLGARLIVPEHVS